MCVCVCVCVVVCVTLCAVRWPLRITYEGGSPGHAMSRVVAVIVIAIYVTVTVTTRRGAQGQPVGHFLYILEGALAAETVEQAGESDPGSGVKALVGGAVAGCRALPPLPLTQLLGADSAVRPCIHIHTAAG